MKLVERSSIVASPHSGPARTGSPFRMVSPPVYISVMLFAMSTWIGIVGVWVEMPLLVDALPESWKLPSYLVIIIQCANLGPATYAIWDKVRRRNQHRAGEQTRQQEHQSCVDAEVIVSLTIILTAILSMLLLSFFWNQTTVIASGGRSVALLALVAFAALSCCTSSVVFLPYMARFPSVYISAYYFGQGLCGLVPGVLGLAQLAGQEPHCDNRTNINDTGTTSSFNASDYYYHEPRFSVSAFFVLIFVLLCVSLIAFCCLNFVRVCRRQMTVSAADERRLAGVTEVPSAREASGVLEGTENSDSDVTQSDVVIVRIPAAVLRRRRYISLLVTIGVVSALWNGILPATQTYTSLPYGNIVYRLSVCLSWVVSPLATLPNMFAPTSSLSLIVGLGTVASMLSALHLVLAAQSPHPILQGSVVGQVIVVSLLACYYHCPAFSPPVCPVWGRAPHFLPFLLVFHFLIFYSFLLFPFYGRPT